MHSVRPLRNSRGQALVELAIIMPVILALLLAAVDMGRIMFVSIGVQNAAREGAAYGSFHPGCPTASVGPCTDPNNLTFVARQELAGDPALTVVVTCSSTCVSTTTRAGVTMEVSVSYPVQLLFPGLTGNAFTLEASSTAVIQ